MEQNGKSLSMHNKAIWKGTYDDNGMLLKIHENAYTIGYSALLSPDETSAGKVYFGDGVFYDAHQKDNKVFAANYGKTKATITMKDGVYILKVKANWYWQGKADGTSTFYLNITDGGRLTFLEVYGDEDYTSGDLWKK